MLAKLAEKKLIWPGVATFGGLAVLVSLGVWQLERLAWKEGLIASIAVRTKAAPVDIGEAQAAINAGGDIEYLRVRARGRFLNDKERYLYAPDPELGPGYHVYTPFELASGRAVLFVNRGYVPERLKTPETRAQGQLEGEVEITGLLRKPATKGAFTPENDAKNNLWYWRDYRGLFASAFGDIATQPLPVFLDAEAAAAGGWPKGGATWLELPNRHLEYAITWFGLAVTLLAVFLAFAVTRLRGNTDGSVS
jgi:surfeit locus 1 family protein